MPSQIVEGCSIICFDCSSILSGRHGQIAFEESLLFALAIYKHTLHRPKFFAQTMGSQAYPGDLGEDGQ